MSEIRSEKDVKRAVKKLLDLHAWFWWCPPANAYGRSGISDFHSLRDGVFMVVETKFNDKPTPLQRGFLSSIRATNGLAFVVDEKRIEIFGVWLQLFDQAVKIAGTSKVPPAEIGGPLLDAMKVLMEGY